MPRRAITLGGGGPAAGLHIGVLEALADHEITFDVWSLSCIGAWVGIVYNQCDEGKEVEQTYQFFRDGVFRDDEGYKRFPINTVFGPDWRANIDAVNKFVSDPKNYKDFQWQPYRMFDYVQESLSIFFDHMPRGEKERYRKLDEGDLNRWILNQVMAPNPFIRYLTSLMYLSNFNGLSKINYPDSDFMKKIKFEKLYAKKDKLIFHNAWNLDTHELTFFANRPMPVTNRPEDSIKKRLGGPITAESLCACSALPFIEETVKIDGTTYCEGALVDTVNFEGLIEQHGDKLDEIWISRIVDSKQIRKPKNLHDALANLCQLFAASVGEDDVRLFKYHVKYDKPQKWTGTVVEIHVPGHINFKWNHSNLDKGRELGRRAAEQAIKTYDKQKRDEGAMRKAKEPLFINEKPEKDDRDWQRLQQEYLDLQEELAET
ncbi:patatin-like phospholipase family protein [Bradyrhizobium sp. ARR65]|uniref:patatin-like phospholipase family protein n=1 Tax=Bradyrhizobium sp. ARR65 TaxID=1040989 RepID=UPI0004669A42|nr:patatin-like phospholipase family protein [Bradyrhizobium sp. ARR65]